MPLLKGKSMRDMFFMPKRMTIWTQNDKVVDRILISISVFMMNLQNFWMFIISAIITFIDKSSTFHCTSDTLEISSSCFFYIFRKTFLRTEFPAVRQRRFKFFATVFAFFYRFAFVGLRFIITFPRTVFSLSFSTSLVREQFSAYIANTFKILERRHTPAFAGTEFCCIKSIQRNIKFLITKLTSDYFSCFFESHLWSP